MTSRAILVTLTWWGGNARRLTTWSDPITVGVDTWSPLAVLDVRAPELGLDVTASKLTMTLEDQGEPFFKFAREPHASVDVVIETIDPNDLVQRHERFRGRLASPVVPTGRDGSPQLLEWPVLDLLDEIDATLSYRNAVQCSNVLGALSCPYDVESNVTTATTFETDGESITVELPDGETIDLDRYDTGSVFAEGVAMEIVASREVGTRYELTLFEDPPAAWRVPGFSLELREGCDGTLTSCRRFFPSRSYLPILILGRHAPEKPTQTVGFSE